MARTDEAETTDLLIALSHPLRRKILRTLADRRPRSPSQLAKSLDSPLPSLSYHMRVLADRGAVRLVKTVPVRGSRQHFYLPTIEADWARAVLEGADWPKRRRRLGRLRPRRRKKGPGGEKPPRG
jgi:DNA-binding transcriptional ArsR family regulator